MQEEEDDHKRPTHGGRKSSRSRVFGEGVPRSPVDGEGSGSTDAGLELPAELAGLLDSCDTTARPGFRSALRDAFVGGTIRPATQDPADESELPDVVRAALDAWTPVPPAAAGRDAVREAFLAAGPPSRHASGAPSAAAHRHGGERQPAPAPARRMSTQLRLVIGGGLLAAAAAVLILLRGGLGGAEPSDARVEIARADGAGWALDAGTIDALGERALLAAIRVDGEALPSLDDFGIALASAKRIEVGDASIRMRRGDAYVMELGEGTEVRFEAEDPTAPEGSDVLFAASGAVRVATGPGFDPSVPLVVHTPHLRTAVTGTIYGIDVYEQGTCVCCLEGSVEARSHLEGALPFDVPAAATRVLALNEVRPDVHPLEASHADPLRKLQGYWL